MATIAHRIQKIVEARAARAAAIAAIDPQAQLWRWLSLIAHAANLDPAAPLDDGGKRALRAAELFYVAKKRSHANDAITFSNLA